MVKVSIKCVYLLVLMLVIPVIASIIGLVKVKEKAEERNTRKPCWSEVEKFVLLQEYVNRYE